MWITNIFSGLRSRVVEAWGRHFGGGWFRFLRFVGVLILLGVAAYALYKVRYLLIEPTGEDLAIYGYLGLLLLVMVFIRYLLHGWLCERAIREQPDYVQMLIVEAETILAIPDIEITHPEKHSRLSIALQNVREKRPYDRTYWSILPLSKALVDWYDDAELITQTNLKLDDLRDFREDDFTSYDAREYEKKAREVKDVLASVISAKNRDEGARNVSGNTQNPYTQVVDNERRNLRATLKSLLIYVADLDSNFGRGAVLLGGVKLCCYLSIPILLFMGLLPIVLVECGEFTCSPILSWYNFAFLATSSALVAVLKEFLGQEEVQVGSTQGLREVSRALIAASAGFFSGVAVFSLVSSELAGQFFAFDLVPNLVNPENILVETWKSVFWSLVAGFLFERFINRIRDKANV